MIRIPSSTQHFVMWTVNETNRISLGYKRNMVISYTLCVANINMLCVSVACKWFYPFVLFRTTQHYILEWLVCYDANFGIHVSLSVCLCVCLSLDNLSTSTSIVFLVCTGVGVLLGQSPINFELYPLKPKEMARILVYFVVILTSL